jgi:outer membrane protein OmpA-like peptidoglycan-associated protein
MPMLVSSACLELPVIHALCALSGTQVAQSYFLDQPTNPLLPDGYLKQSRAQMIKTDFPVNVPAAASSIETALAEKEPVQIYSIDFNFNSTTIKPDSEAVMKRIPGIPHNNSDWKLSVAGYTDNIGEATPNQQFSKRRAKRRCLARNGIALARLPTKGFGAQFFGLTEGAQ